MITLWELVSAEGNAMLAGRADGKTGGGVYKEEQVGMIVRVRHWKFDGSR